MKGDFVPTASRDWGPLLHRVTRGHVPSTQMVLSSCQGNDLIANLFHPSTTTLVPFFQNDVLEYDTKGDAWKSYDVKGPAPKPLSFHTATAVGPLIVSARQWHGVAVDADVQTDLRLCV